MHRPKRVRLGFGILKIKPGRFLRQAEKDGQFPMVKLGNTYWIWVSNQQAELATHQPHPSQSRRRARHFDGPSSEAAADR